MDIKYRQEREKPVMETVRTFIEIAVETTFDGNSAYDYYTAEYTKSGGPA